MSCIACLEKVLHELPFLKVGARIDMSMIKSSFLRSFLGIIIFRCDLDRRTIIQIQ